jgi:hypothetical protein
MIAAMKRRAFITLLGGAAGNITGFASHEWQVGGGAQGDCTPTSPEPSRSCTLKLSHIGAPRGLG